MRFREGKGVKKLEKQRPLRPTGGTAAPFHCAFIQSFEKKFWKRRQLLVLLLLLLLLGYICAILTVSCSF